mmetsp:Transcript_27181/g.57136  ORF Transcript_27181/g.57136 Transcript_27181/m.57136 type:complete len:220 (-) Transcript_27181:6-665(-)
MHQDGIKVIDGDDLALALALLRGDSEVVTSDDHVVEAPETMRRGEDDVRGDDGSSAGMRGRGAVGAVGVGGGGEELEGDHVGISARSGFVASDDSWRFEIGFGCCFVGTAVWEGPVVAVVVVVVVAVVNVVIGARNERGRPRHAMTRTLVRMIGAIVFELLLSLPFLMLLSLFSLMRYGSHGADGRGSDQKGADVEEGRRELHDDDVVIAVIFAGYVYM